MEVRGGRTIELVTKNRLLLLAEYRQPIFGLYYYDHMQRTIFCIYVALIREEVMTFKADKFKSSKYIILSDQIYFIIPVSSYDNF